MYVITYISNFCKNVREIYRIQKGKELYPIDDEINEMDAKVLWRSMSFEHPTLSKSAVRYFF